MPIQLRKMNSLSFFKVPRKPKEPGSELTIRVLRGKVRLPAELVAIRGEECYPDRVERWIRTQAFESPQLFRDAVDSGDDGPEWEPYELTFGTWLPPNLAPHLEPTCDLPLPLPDRQLTRSEGFAALAAIHDYYWRGDKIGPWTDEKMSNAAPHFAVLLAKVEVIPASDEPCLRGLIAGLAEEAQCLTDDHFQEDDGTWLTAKILEARFGIPNSRLKNWREVGCPDLDGKRLLAKKVPGTGWVYHRMQVHQMADRRDDRGRAARLLDLEARLKAGSKLKRDHNAGVDPAKSR